MSTFSKKRFFNYNVPTTIVPGTFQPGRPPRGGISRAGPRGKVPGRLFVRTSKFKVRKKHTVS